jgi:hypothetical protein
LLREVSGTDRKWYHTGGNEAKDKDAGTPLLAAAVRGHEAIARLLLEKGADIKGETGTA